MMDKTQLASIVDEFIQEKNASWNHEDWLMLLIKVKDRGIDISENALGEYLEAERQVFYAKNSGNFVYSREKLLDACREFVKRTQAEFSEEQKIDFMNGLSSVGIYNKYELLSILDSEKKRFLENRKKVTIDLEELEDLRKGISELQRKISVKDSNISELNSMIEKMNSELMKNEHSFKSHIQESVSKDKLLEILKNDMRFERDFIENTTRSLLEKEQSINAKEAELKAKGLEVSNKLTELTKQLEYYKLLEKKSEVDSGKLQKLTGDISHQKSINNILTRKVSLLEGQLHSKITELEKIKVVYKEMHESYSREKNLLVDAEKRLREFGRDAMENKIEAEKKQEWILEHEKPLIEMQGRLAREKKELKDKETALLKEKSSITEKLNELSAREKDIIQKETRLVLSYKELEKKKSEISIAKKEVDAKYGETGKSLKDKQAKIDLAIKEYREKSDSLAKERLSLEKIRADIMQKESHLKGFYSELQGMKDRLDKREIIVAEKERKLEKELTAHNATFEENKSILGRYKNSLDRFKTELSHKEKELDEKRKKIHNEMLHVEEEKLKLEKKFLGMITSKD